MFDSRFPSLTLRALSISHRFPLARFSLRRVNFFARNDKRAAANSRGLSVNRRTSLDTPDPPGCASGEDRYELRQCAGCDAVMQTDSPLYFQNNARQILAEPLNAFLITSPDVSTY